VGVAVADDLEVEVVGLPAAGEHGVQQLPGLLPREKAVHGVGGDALGGMDGAGVAETGRGAHIVNGQLNGQLAAGMPHSQVTLFGDVGDDPPVAVLNPIGGAQSEPAVVAAGDDHISDTGLIAVGQTHLPSDRDVAEAMLAGATVEFGDQLAGRGEHDGVQSGRSVQDPSGEGVLGGLSEVADVDAIVIEIEVDRLWFAFAEGQ
jgi:hypothetical protein